MIIRYLYFTPTPSCDKTIITHEIELSPDGKKIDFDLLDDEDFTIPYVTDIIPNSPASHILPTQAKKNGWIIAINGKYHIKYQGALDELNNNQNTRGKLKVKISLLGRKIYWRTYLEDIFSIFDQVIPVVSHLEFCLP